ncbi:MAG TPA: diacylglycerol kinase family protein, partial [Candidatus Dormibacteraeota bacterium]|nr:diacylglycerol kinase family protein [Candidatus Dormibacteraeota bacterium]
MSKEALRRRARGWPDASGARRAADLAPLIIVNPSAGGGRARGFWRRCAISCAADGVAVDVVETSRRGDAADFAAAAGDRLVIAVGGDGTAHEVVNGLLRQPGTRPPRVGFLQRGTGADLRRSLPSPRRPEDVAAWLTTDRWRPLDAGWLATSTGRRYFINVADAGIGAEVVRRA